jgi:hypothetical protein
MRLHILVVLAVIVIIGTIGGVLVWQSMAKPALHQTRCSISSDHTYCE